MTEALTGFWKTGEYGFLITKNRHNNWQNEEMNTEDLSKFSTRVIWRPAESLNIKYDECIVKCEDPEINYRRLDLKD